MTSVASQDDHWNLPLRSLLILVVVRPHGGHDLPQLGLLLGGCGTCMRREPITLDLDVHLRVGNEIHIPRRGRRGSTFGTDHQVIVAVTAEDERRTARRARLSSGCGEDED